MAATLYLASASPRRSQLLAQAGIAFERFVVPVDEDALTAAYSGPIELLGEYLAQQKARAAYDVLHPRGEDALVLASDTTVLLDGRSLPKPRDLDEAAEMLRLLRGREHVVATGVALAGPEPGRLISGASATRVRMRDYADEEIAAYVATGDPLDKAGAYSIQHPDFHPVAVITGCHLGVIGLPVCLVGALLGHWPAVSAAIFADGAHPPACAWSAQCHPPLPPTTALHRVVRDPTST
jgi:septum formation protein